MVEDRELLYRTHVEQMIKFVPGRTYEGAGIKFTVASRTATYLITTKGRRYYFASNPNSDAELIRPFCGGPNCPSISARRRVMPEPVVYILWDVNKDKPISPVKVYVNRESALSGATHNTFRHRPVRAVPLYRECADINFESEED